MLAIQIEDIKNFMSHLLLKDTFDDFSVAQIEISTGNTLTIDGHLNRDFFDNEECLLEDGSPRQYAYWSELRELCFSRIKGKKLPLFFQISLLLTEWDRQQFLLDDDSSDPAVIENYYLNIRYDSRGLFCTSGASYKLFTMNKSAELGIDQYIQKLFSHFGIQ